MRYIDPCNILNARFEGKERPDWDAVILIFRDARGSAIVKEALGCRGYGERVLCGMEAAFTHEMRMNNNKTVGVIEQCIWGGPQISILVEEISELGIGIAIGIGACGSTVPRLPKGTQVYATRSLTTDGTSKMYTSKEFTIPSKGLAQIAESLDSKKLSAATAASVDAVYQETKEFVDSLIGLGTEIINMESSAFYAASVVCNIESLWIGHVSDCISGDKWEEWNNIEDMTRESALVCRDLLARALSETHANDAMQPEARTSRR